MLNHLSSCHYDLLTRVWTKWIFESMKNKMDVMRFDKFIIGQNCPKNIDPVHLMIYIARIYCANLQTIAYIVRINHIDKWLTIPDNQTKNR